MNSEENILKIDLEIVLPQTSLQMAITHFKICGIPQKC